MNIYFDTEFTGLVPGTTLISLGMVCEDGQKFYAEFDDYDESKVTDWVRDVVIKNLAINKKSLYNSIIENFETTTYVYGATSLIKSELLKWLEKVRQGERVQFISDVCHYDMYLLTNQIFGGAFEMPDWINPCCYDLVWDIEEWECMGVGNNFNATKNMYHAFDISRELLISRKDSLKAPEGDKHNALYDAEVIKLLYEYYYKEKFWARKRNTIESFKEGHGCRDFFDTWFEDEEYLKATLEWDTRAYLREKENEHKN